MSRLQLSSADIVGLCEDDGLLLCFALAAIILIVIASAAIWGLSRRLEQMIDEELVKMPREFVN
jgi:hypothetical protein